MTAELHEIELAPNEQCIHYFTDLLERAKTGEIQGFAIAIHKSRALTANGWVNISINPMAMLGEIEAMKIDMVRAKVDQRFDCCGDSTY